MVPSSMSKIMTLYMVFERLEAGVLKLDDTFRVSEKAWRMGGSKMFVRVDTRVSIEDLIRGVSVQSGNDACIVLAEGIAGSEEVFVERMNEKAKELGLEHSHFKNATGWPDEGHIMSAYDLALLSKRMIEDFPDYYSYLSEKEFMYNDVKQSNRNSLLWNEESGVDGLKTGHTEVGGYGVVVSSKKDNQRMVVVVNGLENQDERSKEAERLLSMGFRFFEREVVLDTKHELTQAKVWQGMQDSVALHVNENIELTVPRLEKKDIKFEVHYNAPLIAPIQEGTEVGEVHIFVPGQETRVYPLFTKTTVKRLGIIGRLLGAVKK
jgi:D-alanyl-D-alanine carboxypeptidase (penicillin-binding protein 5/6)